MNWEPPNAHAARVEEACLNAWPALQEIHYDGWLIRLADGQTRRTNSVNILSEGALAPEAKIGFCEDIYRQHGLPTYFRILSTSAERLDTLLAARGYEAEAETSTLFMDFALNAPTNARRPVEMHEGAPTAEWLREKARIAGQSVGEMRKVEKILQQLALPAVFAAVRDEGGLIRSVAKGAMHDGIVVFNLVATDATHRRRGYSRDCLSAILVWARNAGATSACLQVVAANAPAIALYQGLGFTQELYRYHYRRRAMGED